MTVGSGVASWRTRTQSNREVAGHRPVAKHQREVGVVDVGDGGAERAVEIEAGLGRRALIRYQRKAAAVCGKVVLSHGEPEGQEVVPSSSACTAPSPRAIQTIHGACGLKSPAR